MSRRAFAAVAIATAFVGIPGSARATTLADIRRRGHMLVATEDNYPPFESMQNNQPAGFDHDLYRLLRQWAPFEVRQTIIPFQGLLAGVITGQFDVALTAAVITDQRAQQLDFAMPIAEATHFYVKRKGDNRIRSVRDLGGLTVGLQQGSSIQQRLPQVDQLLQSHGGRLGRVVAYASYPEAFQDLAIGRIDYVLHSVVALADLVRRRPNDFEMGEAVVPVSYHAWAVKKGNRELRDFLNQFLTEQWNNGTMVRLQEQWFGRAFPNLPRAAMLPGNRPIPD